MRRHSPPLMILALLGALGLSQVAAAAAAQPMATTSTPSPLRSSVLLAAALEAEEDGEGEEAEDEGEEVEFEIEEEVLLEGCESAADEFEFEDAAEEREFEEEVAECEKEAKKKGKSASFVSAPEECVVERAESTIQTLPGSDRVRLTVRYENYSPGAVAIGLKLKDHKGSLALEHSTKHLGHDGTLRLTTKLGESEMERAEDAREFDVALRAPGTPGYCGEMLEQRLRTAAPLAARGSGAHGSSRVFRAPSTKG